MKFEYAFPVYSPDKWSRRGSLPTELEISISASQSGTGFPEKDKVLGTGVHVFNWKETCWAKREREYQRQIAELKQTVKELQVSSSQVHANHSRFKIPNHSLVSSRLRKHIR